MKSFNSSTSIQKILIEFFSIVVGVLFALGVNQWRENISNEERAQTALINIKNEIETNQKTLKYIFENNKSTIDLINKKEKMQDDSNATYIPAIQLQETAWNTMLNTDVSSHIDYEVLMKLSSTYSIQEVYKRTAQSFVDANLTLAALSIALEKEIKDDMFTTGFSSVLLMLNNVEMELLNSYKGTLEVLEQNMK